MPAGKKSPGHGVRVGKSSSKANAGTYIHIHDTILHLLLPRYGVSSMSEAATYEIALAS